MAKSKHLISLLAPLSLGRYYDNTFSLSWRNFVKIDYPRIVDDSQYRSDHDVIKDYMRSGKVSAQSASAGRYDYRDNSPDKMPKDLVNDSLLQLRSRGLKREEVSDLIRYEEESLKSDIEGKRVDAADKAEKARGKARADALDKILNLGDNKDIGNKES